MSAAVALVQVTSECCRPAGHKVSQDSGMGGRDLATLGLDVVCPMRPYDVRELERGGGHRS
jgi:hypothetical protein